MNFSLNHSDKKSSDAKIYGARRCLMRVSNLAVMVMTGLALFGWNSGLNAADTGTVSATGGIRDKSGFLINIDNPPVVGNAESNNAISKTTVAPIVNSTSGNQVAVSTTDASALNITNIPAPNVLDDKYHLAIGDQLSFQILEDEDPPVHLVVTDSGDLQVPYLGRYPAVGKTCKQLAQELKVELEKEYYKRATVIIAVDAKPRSRGKIYLVGAIRAPGPEDISSEEVLTVSKAILRAGGFTDYADQKNVKVTRSAGSGSEGEQTFIVDVSKIFEDGKTTDDLPLQPGDLIFVPERMVRF